MTMSKDDTSILSVLDDNTNTEEKSNKKEEFVEQENSKEVKTANNSKEEELKSSFLDLINQLNELKKGSLNLEDLNLSKYKTVLEETPANWEFSEETESYNTTFEFDEWSDLDTFNDFFKRENVDWSVFSNESNQFIVSLTTPDRELAEEFNELFTKEEEEETEKKPKDVPKKKLNSKREFSSEKELDLVPLITSQLTCFEQGENQYVKIPIARLGSWVHPEYGEIEFKEEDLNRLQSSIESNELGWEPPLFYGHPQEGGAPAEGYLLKAFREGETLFGIWSVNQTTYEEIKKGRFRYSSAEFLENYISKRSGEELGNVLVGMALTNRPFIPDLPKNVALDEESNTYNFSMELSLSEEENYNENDKEDQYKYSSMAETKNEEQKLREELDNYKAQLTDQQNKLEEYNQELKAVKESYESQLQHANEQIKELTQRIRSSEVEEKINRLEQFNIPQTEKDRYKELLKNGSLGSSEDDVMRSLEEMSNSFGSTLLEQHGQSTTTQEENKKEQEDGDPLKQSPHYKKYKENLERAKNNKKQM